MWLARVSTLGKMRIGLWVRSDSGRNDESIIQTHGAKANTRMQATGSSVPSSRRSRFMRGSA